MPRNALTSNANLSRRAAVAGLGAGSLTLALAAAVRPAAAQDATPDARATPSAADAELTELIRSTERERLRALVEADMDVAEQLHADDFQLINPAGGALSKEEYLGGIASGGLDYLVFEPVSEIRVHLYDQAAVIRYQSQLQIVIEGQDIGLSNYWHTDVYERREGRWQAVWSQATEIL
jgi:hypothetical protein